MSKSVKIIAYVVLTFCVITLGYAFQRNYAQIMAPPPEEPATAKPAAAGDTSGFHTRKVAHMMMIGAGLLGVVVGLGLLLAHDATHWLAHRFQTYVFDDEGEGIKTPEYEHAEELWKEGKPLEAIQLMRDYLKDHPREQYVALRIAEIYENDLGNYLAAALEYEEILKKKLRPERWGWTAIHLANLYSGKLDRSKDAEALLHRIAEEFGQTTAAKKARERLGLPEPVEETPPEPEPPPAPPPPSIEEQMAELQAQLQAAPDQPEPPPPVDPESEKSTAKLPPGFRPKNG